MLHQGFGAAAVLGIDGHADAAGHLQPAAADAAGAADRGQDLAGDPVPVAGTAGVGQQDQEFVAAQAGHGVALAQLAGQARGDDPQQLVADAVAVVSLTA